MSEERATKNDLVTFAGPIFDLILRLKAGIVAPSNDLRPQAKQLLDDFEKRAERYRFSHKIIQVSKFALAAFIDETVLMNNFPLRDEWERYALQLELFGEQLAGNKFFEKLQSMVKQIEVTQDAVEVYYICMLLGFRGRFAVYEQDRFRAILEETAAALVKVGKIKSVDLAPHWLSTDQPKPPPKRGMPVWAKISALTLVGLAFLAYFVMFLLSSKFLQDAVDVLNLKS